MARVTSRIRHQVELRGSLVISTTVPVIDDDSDYEQSLIYIEVYLDAVNVW
jgi:hypothetical protein